MVDRPAVRDRAWLTRDVHVVLERAARHEPFVHEVVRLEVGGGHQHELAAVEREAAHRLGELDIVADQQSDAHARERERDQPVARRERRPLGRTEEVCLAVRAGHGARALDGQYAVVDAAVGGLGETEAERDPTELRDPRRALQLRPVQPERPAADALENIASEEELRQQQQVRARAHGGLGQLVELREPVRRRLALPQRELHGWRWPTRPRRAVLPGRADRERAVLGARGRYHYLKRKDR